MGKLYNGDYIIMGTVFVCLFIFMAFVVVIPNQRDAVDSQNSKPVECVVINYRLDHQRNGTITYNLKTLDNYYFVYDDRYPDITFREGDTVVVKMGKKRVHSIFSKKLRIK